MALAPKKHVIVPVDFSDASFDAVREARTLVESPDAVEVVHVLPMLSPMDPGVVWDAWNDDSRRSHATDALRKRLDERGLTGVRITALIGDPAREIAHLAETRKTDLIVIPSHGRTGAARVLIGSVAERVVRHAHCPVLVLRQ
jgi:nucleotide-binding universal stress UspA family protein